MIVRAWIVSCVAALAACTRHADVAAISNESIDASTAAKTSVASSPSSAFSVDASLEVDAAANDGAPKIIITSSEDFILEKIHFPPGSGAISAESVPIVDESAKTFVAHSTLIVLVQGFSDDPGGDAVGVALSKARADAVRDALVKNGVSRLRLYSMGFGPYCPTDPSATAAAHERNRRVELRVIETSEGPTGVEVGCPLATKKGLVFTR